MHIKMVLCIVSILTFNCFGMELEKILTKDTQAMFDPSASDKDVLPDAASFQPAPIQVLSVPTPIPTPLDITGKEKTIILLRNQIPLILQSASGTTCPICHITSTKGNLRHHLLVHTEERPFKCSKCSMAFKANWIKDNHEREVHECEKKIPCDECSHAFTSHGRLKQHKMRQHSSVRYTCPDCGFEDKNKYNLKRHRESRLGCTQFLARKAATEIQKTPRTAKKQIRRDTGIKIEAIDLKQQKVVIRKDAISGILKQCTEVNFCFFCGQRQLSKQSFADHLLTHTRK
jgi:predicted RNA-binding Zn-ribbon protein involved in translation (DUF1610 family)